MRVYFNFETAIKAVIDDDVDGNDIMIIGEPANYGTDVFNWATNWTRLSADYDFSAYTEDQVKTALTTVRTRIIEWAGADVDTATHGTYQDLEYLVQKGLEKITE